MEDCIFCKIARGEIPSKKVYEDDDFIAFLDVSPQAKEHILVIPRIHKEDALDCVSAAPEIFSKLVQTAIKVAKLQGLDSGGFRVVTNNGVNARQSVNHVHIHLLGGELLNERLC